MRHKKDPVFPEGFLWGASSAAWQVEGATLEDGRSQSVIDLNSQTKKPFTDNSVASDHYHHFREDVALMKECGFTSYRFSMSWSRIIPDSDRKVNPLGIKFYNDSIATAQEAVINAVKAIGDVDTLILGGMDRGLDYHPLVDFLRKSNVRNVILLPATSERFRAIFAEDRYLQGLFPVNNMREAVEQAYALTTPSKSCLLSPAAASYGFYKNFEERGDDYKNLVNMLK